MPCIPRTCQYILLKELLNIIKINALAVFSSKLINILNLTHSNVLDRLLNHPLSMSFSRCNAKFLWKRIPQNITSSNPELAAIWAIGQKLWKKDLAGTYQAIAGYNWTEPEVANIIRALEGMISLFY